MDDDPPRFDPEGEVKLYHSAITPAGMRTAAYFGSIVADVFTQDRDWEKAWGELHAKLRDRALSLGGNAVLGMEESADPFAVEGEAGGIRLTAQGTAVRLVRLEV